MGEARYMATAARAVPKDVGYDINALIEIEQGRMFGVNRDLLT